MTDEARIAAWREQASGAATLWFMAHAWGDGWNSDETFIEGYIMGAQAERAAVLTEVEGLRSALRSTLALINNAPPHAWSNGNVEFGLDEGDVLSARLIETVRAALRTPEVSK